jgi:hypothetical protein
VGENLAYLIKSWQEYLLFFLLATFIAKNKFNISREAATILFGILVLSVWGVFGSVVNRISLFDAYLGWRTYMLPLLLCFLLWMNNAFVGIDTKFCFRVVIVISIVSVFGAIYQKLVFNGYNLDRASMTTEEFFVEGQRILKEFWFFDKFGGLHMLRSWPNYVRDGSVRATAFFVSPISYAEFLVVSLVILMAKIGFNKMYFNRLAKYGTAFLLIFAGTYLSNARIGMLLVVLAFFIIFLLKKGNFSGGVFWVIISMIILFTFYALIALNVGDESAQGRLPQYLDMFKQFSLMGYGFGSDLATSYFDSLYISLVMLFGIGVLIYFFVHSFIIRSIFARFSLYNNDPNATVLVVVSLALAFAFAFAFAFQYSIGSCTIPLIYFIFFSTIGSIKSARINGV